MKLKLDSFTTGGNGEAWISNLLDRRNDSLTQVMREASTLSAYCKTQRSDICGECTCLDDYALEERYYCDCQHLPAARDCLEHLEDGYRTSGVYKVNAGGIKDMQVYCDQVTDHGGWTVFQRRVDGEINFYRNWQAYKQGFGTVQREFWLGNDNLYALSLEAAYPKGSELRVDLMDWEGRMYHADYVKFSVDSEEEKYQLLVEGYQGNSGDSLAYHSGSEFSTYDSDNDVASGDCSEAYKGGWWFKSCHYSNLNGDYLWYKVDASNARGVSWYGLEGRHNSMKRVEMKLRRKL